MNLFRKRIGMGLVLLVGMLVGGVATATPITMDFNGLTPGASVSNYYNGGCTKVFNAIKVDCGGADYGVKWNGATVGNNYAGLALTDNATMTIAAGFDGGLSFDYYNFSNFLFTGTVSVYSGKNGNGNLLASSVLGTTGDWDFFSLSFSGLAKSVVFGGTPFYATGFDNVKLGLDAPVHPVPEPAALGVFGLGLLLMGAFAGLRRRYN